MIIVKLADRLHNMRTLESLKPEKRVKIANETLLVFAPLAKLLGMYQVKNELEELAFKWASPEAYAEAGRRLDELSKQQEPTMFRCAAELQKLCDDDPFLKQACAKVVVIPRAKELYGVYRKSQANGGVAKREKNGDGRSVKNALSVVNDVAQLRVVLDLEQKISPPPPGIEPRTVSSNPPTERQSTRVCYHVLGLVHERWPPVPGRMNDYIATPKLNGYRALHTVVLPIGDDQKIVSVSANEKEKANADLVFPIELQIRTGEMHAMAERGIAADPEVVGAWRVAARRTARRLIRERTLGEGLVVGDDGSNDSDESPSSESQAHETNSDHDDTDDTDGTDDEVLSPEDCVLIRAGHARQVAWLSNIREWQEEFLGVLTAEEFVDVRVVFPKSDTPRAFADWPTTPLFAYTSPHTTLTSTDRTLFAYQSQTVTGDLLGRRVFVFTPNGGVMNLPHGATVVDFAFYTDRGLDAVRCSVNGVSSDFDRVLRNADVVEIGRDGGAAWKDSIGGEQKEKRNGSNTYGMEFGSGDGSVDLSTDESSDVWEGGTAITADGEGTCWAFPKSGGTLWRPDYPSLFTQTTRSERLTLSVLHPKPPPPRSRARFGNRKCKRNSGFCKSRRREGTFPHFPNPADCFISQLVTVVHTSRYTILTLFWQNCKARAPRSKSFSPKTEPAPAFSGLTPPGIEPGRTGLTHQPLAAAPSTPGWLPMKSLPPRSCCSRSCYSRLNSTPRPAQQRRVRVSAGSGKRKSRSPVPTKTACSEAFRH